MSGMSQVQPPNLFSRMTSGITQGFKQGVSAVADAAGQGYKAALSSTVGQAISTPLVEHTKKIAGVNGVLTGASNLIKTGAALLAGDIGKTVVNGLGVARSAVGFAPVNLENLGRFNPSTLIGKPAANAIAGIFGSQAFSNVSKWAGNVAAAGKPFPVIGGLISGAQTLVRTGIHLAKGEYGMAGAEFLAGTAETIGGLIPLPAVSIAASTIMRQAVVEGIDKGFGVRAGDAGLVSVAKDLHAAADKNGVYTAAKKGVVALADAHLTAAQNLASKGVELAKDGIMLAARMAGPSAAHTDPKSTQTTTALAGGTADVAQTAGIVAESQVASVDQRMLNYVSYTSGSPDPKAAMPAAANDKATPAPDPKPATPAAAADKAAPAPDPKPATPAAAADKAAPAPDPKPDTSKIVASQQRPAFR
jgi:hypothetical protein